MNPKRVILTAVLSLAGIMSAHADKVDEISGEYTYYGRSDESPAQCLSKAEQGAITQALEQKYGTIITQNLVQTDRLKNGHETNDFMMLSSSEVNGQWLGHTQTPEKKVEMDKDGNIVATVRVKGRAMKISGNTLQYDVAVMRNGTDRSRYTSCEFNPGDDLYTYFSSPTDGYLSIFLADESNEVYCMFPYTSLASGQARMKGGYEYVLFDPSRPDSGFGTTGGLAVTGGDQLEYNKIYVVFSTEPYSLPPMKNPGTVDGYELPPMTEYARFTNWLSKLRATDSRLGVKLINITISPLH